MSGLDENVPSRTPDAPGDTFNPTIDPQSKDDTNIFPLDGVDINGVSNEDLVRLAETAPVLYQIGSGKVLRISHGLVLKCGPLVLPSEGGRPYGVLRDEGFLVMDYVKGQNLGDCWKSLTKHQKDDVICQTAEIISQLQSIPIPTAGRLGGGPCRGIFVTDYGAGPFNSGSEMEAWFNHKLKICKDYNQAAQDVPSFRFREFVLVHQDISPRNMILDDSGKVHLIDWAHAGAYPPAFERAAIAGQHRFPEFNKMILDVIQKYDVQVRQLQSIWYGLTVASLA
ncbi:hypothetical protein AJ79_06353 [Helicocarpus griseus UAMH5409]|uniref:Aminoglycoside phosphotransferase domain-containing protein n=1 Tax=Helicocarpus griseus UAMH5409 TaxID=1447875 RepID=A0A2B7XDQ6_9EURO|nr:hypothetical protein AJ79_06353 [Helicocarpus griseus UAMH5409]